MSDRVVDQELVERVQAGDKRAFDLLVLKYQRKVQRLVARFVRDQGEVDDVVPLASVLDWARPQSLPVTVVPELEWILRSSFELGKEAVLLALSSLLAVELTVKSERAVSRSGDRRAFLDT